MNDLDAALIEATKRPQPTLTMLATVGRETGHGETAATAAYWQLIRSGRIRSDWWRAP
jgi:hypothetical protein